MKELINIFNTIKNLKENIILIYAFNGTGKTRLSNLYKDKMKKESQTPGVYYNSYSEDLFIWNNDINNDEIEKREIKLNIIPSILNNFHSLINEENVREKLKIFNPKYNFKFTLYDNEEQGIKSISFFLKDNEKKTIKISRGEEHNFLWCFFLALFDAQGWYNNEKSYFFIDDPVSSLDDHNIFMTASTIFDLIDNHHKKNKIILTTHHIGIFSILYDWLNKGEKASEFKKNIKAFILSKNDNKLELKNQKEDIFLYHLKILQMIKQAIDEDNLYTYHFVLLRQVLENIASFLGVGRFSYVLEQLDIENEVLLARIINTLSHENIFKYKLKELEQDNKDLLKDTFNKLQNKYNFILHTS